MLVAGPARDNSYSTLPSDGSFQYRAEADWSGTDTFTYRATDGDLQSSVATVTITVNPVNDAPTAVADGIYNTYDNPGGPENNPPLAPLNVAAINGVFANDNDIDGPAPLHAVLVGSPSHAYPLLPTDFVLNDDGSFVYNAADGYTGAHSFTYQACDDYSPSACSATTTVSLYVNSLPVASNDGYSVAEDNSLNVPDTSGVLFNDTDANPGDTLTAVMDTGPTHAASFTLSSDGSFDYEPEANWNGSNSFTYHANDGYFASTAEPSASPATVTITVTAVNDAPSATDDSYTLDEDTTLNVAH